MNYSAAAVSSCVVISTRRRPRVVRSARATRNVTESIVGQPAERSGRDIWANLPDKRWIPSLGGDSPEQLRPGRPPPRYPTRESSLKHSSVRARRRRFPPKTAPTEKERVSSETRRETRGGVRAEGRTAEPSKCRWSGGETSLKRLEEDLPSTRETGGVRASCHHAPHNGQNGTSGDVSK